MFVEKLSHIIIVLNEPIFPNILLPSNRKCDKADCNRIYPTWRVFNCGNSFHIPCLLPSLSTCFLCKEMLSEKLKLLSDRINESVFDTAFQDTTNDSSDDDTAESMNEDEDDPDVPSDLDGDDVEMGDEESRARRVEVLIYKIANWRRPFPTMH